jgi:hypothetical protein
MALLVLAALAPAYFLRPRPDRPSRALGGNVTAKMIGLALLVAAAGPVMGEAADFLGIEALNVDSVNEELEDTAEQTSQGGSAFEPALVRTPLDYPWAAVTVLFRPFLFEAGNAQGLGIALEAMVLAALLVTALRRAARLPNVARNAVYVIFAATFVILFVYAFSSIGNFGILARQRSQVMPLLFVFLALPRPAPEGEAEDIDDGSAARAPRLHRALSSSSDAAK